MYKKQMVPEPPSCVHTAGLPGHHGPAMATLLRELSAFPERGRAAVLAGSTEPRPPTAAEPWVRVLGLCPRVPAMG